MSKADLSITLIVSSYLIDTNSISNENQQKATDLHNHAQTTKSLFQEITNLATTSVLPSNQSKVNLEDELVAAAEDGDIDGVHELLKKLPVLSSSVRGKAVIAAAKESYIKIVKLLLKSGSISEEHYGEALCASLRTPVPQGLTDRRHYETTNTVVAGEWGFDTNFLTPGHLHDAMAYLLLKDLLFCKGKTKRERGLSQEHLDKAYLANALLPNAPPTMFLGAYWESNENSARGAQTFEFLAYAGCPSPELDPLIRSLIGKERSAEVITAAKAIRDSDTAGYEAALEAAKKAAENPNDKPLETYVEIKNKTLEAKSNSSEPPTPYKPVIKKAVEKPLEPTQKSNANTTLTTKDPVNPSPTIKITESGFFGTTVTYYPTVDALLTNMDKTATSKPSTKNLSIYTASSEEQEQSQDILLIALKVLSTSVATFYMVGGASAAFSVGVMSSTALFYGTVAAVATVAAIALYSFIATPKEDILKIMEYALYAFPLIGFNTTANALHTYGTSSPITLSLAVATVASITFSLGAFLYSAIYRNKETETEYDTQLMDSRVNLAKALLPSTAVIATTLVAATGYTLGAVSVITICSGVIATIAAIASVILYLGTETTQEDISEIIKNTQIGLPTMGAYCTLISLFAKGAFSPLTGTLAIVTLATATAALAKFVFDAVTRDKETETPQETLDRNKATRMTKAILNSVAIGSTITAGVIAYTTGIATLFPICFGSVAAIAAIASLILFIGTETTEIDAKKITHNTLLFSGAFNFFVAYCAFFSSNMPQCSVPPVIVTHLVITAAVTIVTNLALYGMLDYVYDLRATKPEKLQRKGKHLTEATV